MLWPYTKNFDSAIEHGDQEKVARILRQNGFSGRTFPDIAPGGSTGTTIDFQLFKITEETEFQRYVTDEFTPGNHEFPYMTPELVKRFRSSLFELFSNSIEHSETSEGIFACGQHFPKLHLLKFAVTDRGIGVVERIRKSLGRLLEPKQAIEWIFQEGSTTRLDPAGRAGGFGLKLIKDFVDVNTGRLIFVSGQGYYERTNKQDNLKLLPYQFPGTSVIIEIATKVHAGYKLINE